MDQAAKLRELVDKKRVVDLNNINIVSVVSGKGGVGKTTLVTKLYNNVNNSYIVDCDVNSPYFWLYEKTFDCCEGFELFNGRNIVKPVDKNKQVIKHDCIFVDAGTGLNDINKYYINKSKTVVFVSNMEEISILNTMNLMKKVKSQKVLYINNIEDDVVEEMQARVHRYSKTYLDGAYVLVTNNIEDIVNIMKKTR